MTKDQAKSSIKSLAFELSNLTPSALITLFEIDLSTLLEAKSVPALSVDAAEVGFTGAVDNILRFHNNIKIFNSKIKWNGKDYWPVPIHAGGFESSSKGTLPTPTLTIASQTDEGVTLLTLLKHEILKYGDIVGCKVTRRRTFAKYLDWENFEFDTVLRANPRDRKFSPRLQELPAGYEPDPNAELPKDIYFIERKTGENKTTLQYQLSSILDLEGVKIPRRVIIADKCNWNYRGPGCWYQEAYEDETKNSAGKFIEQVPILQKAGLTTPEFALPDNAPPIATDKDESITSVIGGPLKTDKKEWNIDAKSSSFTNDDGEEEWYAYNKGDYTYIIKNKIKYYFVAKVDITEAQNRKNPPPNTNYWVADACSKTLGGCRIRWGASSPGAATKSGCVIGGPLRELDGETIGGLPYGGFPAARKVAGGR
jgi:phage-related protein